MKLWNTKWTFNKHLITPEHRLCINEDKTKTNVDPFKNVTACVQRT